MGGTDTHSLGSSAAHAGLSPSLPDLPGFRILLRGILHPGLCYGVPSGLDIIHVIDPKTGVEFFASWALSGLHPGQPRA